MPFGLDSDQSFGVNPNSLKAGLRARRIREAEIGAMMKCIPAIVWDYYPKSQRVDVRDKSHPGSTTIYNIPIMGTGGVFRTVAPLIAGRPGSPYGGQETASHRGKATVGIVLFLDTDSANAWLDHSQHPPTSAIAHGIDGAVFIPHILTTDDGDATFLYEEVDGPDDIGPFDAWMQDDRSGSYMVFKANGDIIIKAAGDVYIGGLDSEVSTYKDAARKGDAGDGVGGGIEGGSDRVHVG